MRYAKNLIPTLIIGFVLGCVASGLVMTMLGGSKTAHVAAGDVEAKKTAILQTLDTQILAWNRGDIEGFMQDYLQSDALRFASGGTVEKGWAATLARYQQRYPDRATMGRLEFSDREVQILSPDNALVFGRWTLIRDNDRPTGLFTLHMQKQDKGWFIISDHTSSAN